MKWCNLNISDEETLSSSYMTPVKPGSKQSDSRTHSVKNLFQ